MVRVIRTGLLMGQKGHRRTILCVLCALCVLRAVVSAETIDRVLAVASGQVIMMSDVVAARDLGLQKADAGGDPIRSILQRLIDRELMLTEVDRYGPPEP